ncbi:MAG: bifunctional metallophosphatase/5'-nucleotidase [Elusimicrobia bacterium]|nr:bifunctional metallophosphatase/5'-nucleotidase [Elusimicrobiota bacterium]
MRAAFLALFLAVPVGAKTVRITVVHTNDMHGWLLPRPDKKTGRPVGGAAALAAFINKERANGGPVLVLDGGDWWQGTPEGSLSKGLAMAEVFDAVGYDATVPGNHEYDGGEAQLKAIIAAMRTPVVAANIAVTATGEPVAYVKHTLVKEVAGIKIGFFGLITSQMRRLSFPQNVAGITFQSEVDAARKAVASLKAQGAELVIMLSHVGQEDAKYPGSSDQAVVRAVPGIDLVVGGHNHFSLSPALRVGGTLVVNTGCYLDKAGKAVLEFDDQTRRVFASTSSLHPLWLDEVGEDPKVKAVVERWRVEVGAALDVVVATAAVALTKVRDSDSPMGNWMTDCTRKWTKTDLAFQNAGGIRTEFAVGPVRLRSIFELMPFDNRLTTLYMKGADLKDLFEHSVGRAPGMLQLSGGSVAYDPAAPEGSRVKGVEVRGRALEPDFVYSIAAPDFVVQGGDGFNAFAAGTDRADHDTMIRDVLGWCARTEGTLRLPVAGRIKRL